MWKGSWKLKYILEIGRWSEVNEVEGDKNREIAEREVNCWKMENLLVNERKNEK